MRKLFAAVITAFIAFSLFAPEACRAEDYVEKYREYTEEGRNVGVTEFLTGETQDGEDDGLDSFLSSLPKNVADMLPDVTGDSDPAAAGEAFGAEYFVGLIFGEIGRAVGKILPEAAVLAAMAVIVFIMKSVSDGGAVSGTAGAVMHAAFCLTASYAGVLSFESVASYLKTLASVANAAVPLVTASLVATGNVTSAGVGAAFITATSDICERIFSGAALPMIAASTALSFAESVFPGGAAVSLSSFVRKAAIWITVAVSTVSSFVFGVQSLLSSAADTAGLKTVKFAVGSFVPFVGSAVGDTVSFIAAGAAGVKSVAGVVLLAVLFALTLTPLVTLVAGKATLFAVSVLCGVLGLQRSSKLFEDLSSASSALIALTVSASSVFLVIVFAFISYGGKI